MAGQTVLIELAQGDRVQVDYIFITYHLLFTYFNFLPISGIFVHLHWTARQAWQPSYTVPGAPSQTSLRPTNSDRETKETDCDVVRII